MRTLAWALAYNKGGYLKDPDKLKSPLPAALFRTRQEALAHLETLSRKDCYRTVRIEILVRVKDGLINRYK